MYEEWEVEFTLMDAQLLIDEIGFANFIEALMKRRNKLLTAEQIEAMQTLHDKWEM